jgi:rubrerythrin
MDIDSLLRDPLSRRRFFRRAGVSAAGGSALLLGACGEGSQSLVEAGPDESDQADVEILNGALDLELMAVAAYKTGAVRLTGELLQVGKLFLAQEQEHADGLTSAIKDAGGKPNRAKSAYDFPPRRSAQDVLKYAAYIENTAIAFYIDALPKLTNGDVRATAASIITTEAEHLAVLRDALGQSPLPAAFVTGKGA